jgi:hypothetical protein
MRQTVRDAARTILIISAVIVMSVGVVSPQPLRPYDPPGFRPQQFQAPPPTPRPAVDEAVYERFRVDVQNMAPPERKKLEDSLRERRERARQEGRDEEVRHNERLLGILASVR